MSLSDDRATVADELYRELLEWPAQRVPATPAALVADLRAMLRDRKRRRELRHPKVTDAV